MADMIFACPNCQQNISCDDSWAGQQLQCPLCQAMITMPAGQGPAAGGAHKPLVPKPPPGKQPSLSIGASRAESAGHNAVRQVPIRQVSLTDKEKSSFVKTYGPIAAGLVILGAAVYFGWPYLKEWQDKRNAAAAEEIKNADGGQVGHISELNNFLDATEPGGAGLGSLAPAERAAARTRRNAEGAMTVAEGSTDPAAAGAAGAAEKPLPVIAPVHSLEVAKVKIPESKVNGMISGTNFLAQATRLDPGAGFQLLRFIEGNPASPDREIQVFLRPRAGDNPTNRVWTVASDQRSGVPTVSKRWKTNPKYAPQTKVFNSGYALKLELKQDETGEFSGSIYLALPDNEQSVVAGKFKISSGEAGVGAYPTAAPVAAPSAVPTGLNPAERAAFDKRYGITPRR